jgi:hypothetical protein
MDNFFNIVTEMFGQDMSTVYYLAGGAFLLIFLYQILKKVRPGTTKKSFKKVPAQVEQPVSNEMVVDKKMAKLAAKAAKEAKKKAKEAAKLAAKHKGKLPPAQPQISELPATGPDIGFPLSPGQQAAPPQQFGPPQDSQVGLYLSPASPQVAPLSSGELAAPFLAMAASPVPEALATPSPGSFRAVQLKPVPSGPVSSHGVRPQFQPQPFQPPTGALTPIAPLPEVSPPTPPAPPAVQVPSPPQQFFEPVQALVNQRTPQSTPVAPQPVPDLSGLSTVTSAGVRIASQSQIPPMVSPKVAESLESVDEVIALVEPLDDNSAEVESKNAEPLDQVLDLEMQNSSLEFEQNLTSVQATLILEVESVHDFKSPPNEVRTQTLVQTSPIESPLESVPTEPTDNLGPKDDFVASSAKVPTEASTPPSATIPTEASTPPSAKVPIDALTSLPASSPPTESTESAVQTEVHSLSLEESSKPFLIPSARPMSVLEGRGGVLKASQTQMTTPIQIDQTQLPRVMKEAVAAQTAETGSTGVATVTVQELEATYQKNIFLNSLEIVYYKLLRSAFTQFLIFPKVTSRAAVTVISKNSDHLKVAENVLTNTTLSFVICDVKLNIRAVVEVVDDKQPPSNKDRARDYILKKAGLMVVRFFSSDTPPDISTLRKLLSD